MKKNSSSGLDIRRLVEAANADEDFIREMLQLFVDRTPAMMEEMKTACREKDFSKTVRIAHRLKPSVQMVGNREITDLLIKIHQLTSEKADCSKGAELINRFIRRTNRIIEMIQEKLTSGKLL